MFSIGWGRVCSEGEDQGPRTKIQVLSAPLGRGDVCVTCVCVCVCGLRLYSVSACMCGLRSVVYGAALLLLRSPLRVLLVTHVLMLRRARALREAYRCQLLTRCIL